MQNNWKQSKKKDNYNNSRRAGEGNKDNKMPASSGLYRIKHGRVLGGWQKTSAFIFIAYIAACSTCGKYNTLTHVNTHTLTHASTHTDTDVSFCVIFDALLNKNIARKMLNSFPFTWIRLLFMPIMTYQIFIAHWARAGIAYA